MNILYIDHYAGSLSLGMEFRPFYLSREWKKVGHNVRIVAADFSHLRKVNPDIRQSFEISGVDGVEFQWIKTRRYNGNGIQRALSMFEFCWELWSNAEKFVKEFKPDVVIASSTYPLDTYPAKKIAKLANAKYIHEGHDLWPLTLTEIGGMSKWHPFVLLMQMAENSAYKNADHVVSVLPNAVEHMLKHGLQSHEKFTCIQNGIVLEDWENPENIPVEHTELFERLHHEGKLIIEYLGGHALSNALDVFIEAAVICKDMSEVAFVLVGDGVEKNRLINKAKSLRNVFFLPSVKKTQVPIILNEANILYVGVTASNLSHYGMSMNKVYDYMMAGKPIIIGISDKVFNNDVKVCNSGITVIPDDAKGIVSAIVKFRKMTNFELKVMGLRGREYIVTNYEYSFLANKFLEILNKKSDMG